MSSGQKLRAAIPVSLASKDLLARAQRWLASDAKPVPLGTLACLCTDPDEISSIPGIHNFGPISAPARLECDIVLELRGLLHPALTLRDCGYVGDVPVCVVGLGRGNRARDSLISRASLALRASDALVMSSAVAKDALQARLDSLNEDMRSRFGTSSQFVRATVASLPPLLEGHPEPPGSITQLRGKHHLPTAGLLVVARQLEGELSGLDAAPIVRAFARAASELDEEVSATLVVVTASETVATLAGRDYVDFDIRAQSGLSSQSLRELGAAADIQIISNTRDPLADTEALYEAMSMGAATVFAGLQTGDDIFVDGKTGLAVGSRWSACLTDLATDPRGAHLEAEASLAHVAGYDVGELEEAVLRLASDPELRKRIGQEAKATISSRLGSHLIRASYEALWQRQRDARSEEPTMPMSLSFYDNISSQASRELQPTDSFKLSRFVAGPPTVPDYPLMEFGFESALLGELYDRIKASGQLLARELVDGSRTDAERARCARHLLLLVKHGYLELVVANP